MSSIQSFSRYQSRLWKYFRNTFLVVGTYFSGLVALELAFPLVLFLSLEASLRYFPKWLQIVILVFVGLQIDWWLRWPLGLGMFLLTVFWLALQLGRYFKQDEAFFIWQAAIFTLFFMIMVMISPQLPMSGFWLQFSLYLLTILIRLLMGKRA